MTAEVITDGTGGTPGQTTATISGGAASCMDSTRDAIASLIDEVAKLIADVGALKTAVDANKAAIDALNADDATLHITASA